MPKLHSRTVRVRHLPQGDSLERSFAGRVKVDGNGCWIFGGDPSSYGHVTYGGVTQRAHRVVYAVMVGPLEPDQHVHHECHVKGCVNPDHLRLVSAADHRLLHAIGASRGLDEADAPTCGRCGVAHVERYRRARGYAYRGMTFHDGRWIPRPGGEPMCGACRKARDRQSSSA